MVLQENHFCTNSQTVIDHAKCDIRQTDKNEQNYNFGQAVFAILRKSKREATSPTSHRKLLHNCFCPKAQIHTFTNN